MERKTVTVYGRKKSFKGEYELSLTPDQFASILDTVLSSVPEGFRDEAKIIIGTENSGSDFELIVHASYERPETDREMNARIERELVRKRRMEEEALKAEQERIMLAAKKEEEEWQQYMVLHAKFGSKLGH